MILLKTEIVLKIFRQDFFRFRTAPHSSLTEMSVKKLKESRPVFFDNAMRARTQPEGDPGLGPPFIKTPLRQTV